MSKEVRAQHNDCAQRKQRREREPYEEKRPGQERLVLSSGGAARPVRLAPQVFQDVARRAVGPVRTLIQASPDDDRQVPGN